MRESNTRTLKPKKLQTATMKRRALKPKSIEVLPTKARNPPRLYSAAAVLHVTPAVAGYAC
jgi:hypothetical protein